MFVCLLEHTVVLAAKTLSYMENVLIFGLFYRNYLTSGGRKLVKDLNGNV